MDVKHGLTDVEYVCELPAFCLEGIQLWKHAK